MAKAITKKKDAKDSEVDLGSLNIGNEQVFVGLLPSGASAVMLKHQPNLQLSCVIPPKDFNINFAAGRAYLRSRKRSFIELTTPTLMMSSTLWEVPTANNFDHIQGEYTLWALDTKRKNAVYVKPYLLANVWERGVICFGRLKPYSLRQAYNYYWTSGFNDELYRNQKHKCIKRVHKYNWHQGCLCDGSKRDHQCDCPKTTHHKHKLCGCTTVGASKKCRGRCGRNADCECCKAIKKVQDAAQKAAEKAGKKKLGVRALARLAVMDDKPFPDCGCGWRHKRTCNCSKGICDCACKCGCCLKTCGHPVCTCACCKEECKCRCACSPMDKLKFHMANYHKVIMPRQKWKQRTEFFCGQKYWAAPKSSTGILISNNKKLLKQIPKEHWRRDPNNQPMIVALATPVKGGWEFDSGYRFSLPNTSVIAK